MLDNKHYMQASNNKKQIYSEHGSKFSFVMVRLFEIVIFPLYFYFITFNFQSSSKHNIFVKFIIAAIQIYLTSLHLHMQGYLTHFCSLKAKNRRTDNMYTL